MRPVQLSLPASEKHASAQAGRDIGGDGDAAIAALRNEGEGGCVVAGKQPELGANERPQPRKACDIACCIFQSDDLRELAEAGDRFVGQTAGRPRWNVVKDDRQAGRLRDGAEMGVQAILDGFIVVGHDGENGIGASGLRIFRQLDRVSG